MPRFIVKLSEEDKNWYLEWSTVVDAPITYGMSLEKFKEFYIGEYGRSSMDELEKRLARVEESGTSCRMDDSVDDTISFNRAGKKETKLTKQQIIDHYCKIDHLTSKEDFKKHEANKPIGTKIGTDD